jgi:RNA polymerase sigma factor (sigma-70 family)
MKKYNVQNYIRYKEDLKKSIPSEKFYDEYTRDELIIKFMPLVENLARKFSTTQQASGVLSINDLIQEGNSGLVKAVDKIDWLMIDESSDVEKTLKSFLSKRIKGAIRRAIDINRGDVKIPEHKLNQIRKNPDDDKMVSLFFNSVFSSYDENYNDEENPIYQIEDKSTPYNIDLLNIYLLGLMKEHLTPIEYEVLRLSFGLDCDKHSANYIANKLKINVNTANVRVSQIKREAIDKLIANTDPTQVIDYL